MPVEDVSEDEFTASPEEVIDESAEEPTEFTCEEVEDIDLLSDNAEDPDEGEDPDDEGITGYDLTIDFETGDWHMLPGTEMKILTSVIARYDDDGDDAIDYELELFDGLEVEDGTVAYDSDLIDVTIPI